MPHFICRWPGGDVLLASVDSRQELDAILQERCEPGVCKVARYHGPLVLELKPDVPGVSRASAERFRPSTPACPSFQCAWDSRGASGDVNLLAADGSAQRVHKLVLQCRLPALHGQPVPPQATQVRLPCVPDAACLATLVQFLYLDDVDQPERLTPRLHGAALRCGLRRLVELCEAHFATQLELQLLSWPGMSQAQRDGACDSFIGWTLYAERLQRQELRQLCVHSLARHVMAAQARPAWSSLSQDTCSLVQLIAASTAPPIIHRSVLPDGSAILPAPSNPGPAGAAPGNSSSVVSVDAEAFAAAGGHMATWEWQQLQGFRAAVASSRSLAEASPLLLEAQQLAACSLGGTSPGLSFSVKPPVLGPHRRLMDSVCRFAFPATHGLLGSGWKLGEAASAGGQGTAAQPPQQQPPPQQPHEQQPEAQQQQQPEAQQQQPEAQQQQPEPQQQQQPPQQQPEPAASQPPQQAVCLPVPVPPVPRALEEECAGSGSGSEPHAVLAATERSNSSQLLVATKAGSTAAAAADGNASLRPSRLSGSSGSTATAGAAPGASQPHARMAAPHQMRLQAAAGAAAALQRGSQDGLGPGGWQGEAHSSWGSAASLASSEAAAPPQAAEQQQEARQLGAAGAESWGSGVSMRQPSSSADTRAAASSATEFALAAPPLPHPHASRRASQHAADSEQCTGSQQLLEGAASTAGEGGAPWWASREQQQVPRSGRLLDLPAVWQPAPRPAHQQAAAAAAAEAPAAAAAAGDGRDAAAAAVPAPAPAAGEPGAAGPGDEPLSLLQRALVEDFVLYEEASAARQHVVGILVAIEQGDTAAGQRLLAPACAELIAATAPAAAPNRLAPHLGASAAAAVAAVAAGASVPAAAGGAQEQAAALSGAAAAAAAAAVGEYTRSTRGMGRLLGMAASSRAALEPSPAQRREQQRRQQQLLLRALQHISARVPWLSQLLASHPLAGAGASGAAGAGPDAGSAAAAPEAGEQEPPPSISVPDDLAAAIGSEAQRELQAAVAELIMQLPELLQGLPAPVMLTQEQFQQRHAQAQQLAGQAMELLAREGPAAGSEGAASEAAAASGLLAAATAAIAAPGPAGELPTGWQQRGQASQVFAHILALLGVSGLAGGHGGSGGAAGAAGDAAGAPGGFVSRAAAFAAANRLAEGLMAGSGTGAGGSGSSVGLSRAGGAAAAGAPTGAWRLQPGATSAGAMLPPGSGGPTSGGLGGAFAPTGVGALLSGGLLAEGGVAGDSMLDDMLHQQRRITCHGLYELCAALARPSDSSPQQQQQPTGAAPGAADLAMRDEGGRDAEGRLGAAEPAAGGAARSRRSSSHASAASGQALSGHKRRHSSSADEREQQAGGPRRA